MDIAAVVVGIVVLLAVYGLGVLLGIRLAGRVNLVPPSGSHGALHMFGFRMWVWSIRLVVTLIVILIVTLAISGPLLALLFLLASSTQ